MTADLDAILREAMQRGSPDTVLLMRLLAEAATEASVREALDRARIAAAPDTLARLTRLCALWDAHPQAWTLVRSVLDGVAHDGQGLAPDEALRSWADVFDRLAAASPEAGVALYALGDPALLAAATGEVVALMTTLGLLAPDSDVLDLGCGIGRFVAALAPHVRSVTGTDISAGMVAVACRRCAGLANVRLLHGNGRDLAAIGDASLDLVLAADVMPYVVQTGGDVSASHVRDFARVLRPGGAVLILNYSYRGDLAADCADIASLAASADLVVERAGERDLTLWDAASFVLRKGRGVSG